MDIEEYNKIAKNISIETNLFFTNFCKLNTEYLPILEDYSKKNIHLNALQFYAGFLASNNKINEWKKYIGLAIAIELIMIWAYKTNRVVDEKQDVWDSREKIKNTLLEHDLILSCIFSLLENLKIVLEPNFEKVYYHISEMIVSMVRGFWIEKRFCNVNYSSLEEILKSWHRNYLDRNVNFNLVYDYSAFIGYSLGKNNWSVFEKYKKEFPLQKRFSHVGQIVNDYGDYSEDIDKNVKTYQDNFSDIKNGIITYPVFKLIDSQIILNALKKPLLLEKKEVRKEIINLISEGGIEKEVEELGEESFVANQEFLSKNIKGDFSLWIKTYAILKKNRFFVDKNYKDFVILCDNKGAETGICNKIEAHQKGLLHKAFSIFVFNKKQELLIQKRSEKKYHSGGLWANTCCSHYVPKENVKISIHNRLKEEMGFDCLLNKKFSFIYKSEVNNNLIENEYDTVFTGFCDKKYKINSEEVSQARWISIDGLKKEISNSPELFAPWLKIILQRTNYFDGLNKKKKRFFGWF